MPEPRADMLPDAEHSVEIVRPDVTVATPPTPPHAASEVVEPVAPVVPKPPTPVGAATPPENLKAALDEERLKRKQATEAREIAEARVRELEDAAAHPEDVVSDDDLTPGEKLLKKQLADQAKTLSQMTKDREVDRLAARPEYAALGDLRTEFETFREDYPANTGQEKLVKIFLAENGLIGAPPARTGLDGTSKGPKATPTTTKFTSEEIDLMMKAEPRRFNALIQKGVIRPEDIPGSM